ncbi:MAG TPA: peptidogalycan biosysnthesis protein, partial [Candidatus Nitrosotenuis sp.]|nr:peptidogalycan biosysnthesis protein [Candidatus Nitrosotenuis sp.]
FFFLKRGDDYVAGSCNILEHNMLHGRFWGSQTDMPFIHFEVCYYMPLEYAIANNIARMEAGLCNLQKELRGFLPELKLNFHYFANSSFKSYIQSTLQEKSFKFINIYKEQ